MNKQSSERNPEKELENGVNWLQGIFKFKGIILLVLVHY